MAIIELDTEIINNIRKEFDVPKETIVEYADFFSKILKPQIKKHYLSHLVRSIEETINEKKKVEVFKRLDEVQKEDITVRIKHAIANKNVRLFSILELKSDISSSVARL